MEENEYVELLRNILSPETAKLLAEFLGALKKELEKQGFNNEEIMQIVSRTNVFKQSG